MKRCAIVISLTALLFAVTGCSRNTPPEIHIYDYLETTAMSQPTEEPDKNPFSGLFAPAETEYIPDHDPWRENPDIFGTPVHVTNSDGSMAFQCNVPEYDIIHEENGYTFINCLTDHILLLGVSDTSSPEIKDLNDFFPAYAPQLETYMDKHHFIQASDHSLTLKESEICEINGYTMAAFRGVLTYRESSNQTRDWNLMCYVVQLESGNYAYLLATHWSYQWVQTKEYAVNMAHSFTAQNQ